MEVGQVEGQVVSGQAGHTFHCSLSHSALVMLAEVPFECSDVITLSEISVFPPKPRNSLGHLVL
jgi:hypothetical protein